MVADTLAANVAAGERMVVAPTANGKYSPLLSPFAKNSLATLKHRAVAVIARMPRAYSSAQTTMSCWRWTQPFGGPVLPEEYNQNAGASLLVGSASSESDPCAIRSDNDRVPASAVPLPATTTARSQRRFLCRIPRILGRSASATMTTDARESSSTYSWSAGVHNVFAGIGTAPILMAPKKL